MMLSAPLAIAQVVNFNNNCDGQIPINQALKWFGGCPDPTYGETNWDGNVLPGPDDDAVIDASYGPIQISGINGTHAEVSTVNAAGGILLDVSSSRLTLTAGESYINGLQLTNNADITAAATVLVILDGDSRLGADVRGPCEFDSIGNLDLNGCRLWGESILINSGGATLSSSGMLLGDGNTTFFSDGTLSITAMDEEILGEGSWFNNLNSMTFSRADSWFFIDPNCEQQGTLSVEAGTLIIRGLDVWFLSGTISISGGAELELANTPFGGDQFHQFNGLSGISGDGLLDIFETYVVREALDLSVGSGDPDTGNGGTRLQSTLDLEGTTLTNSGRFRFNGGTVDGTDDPLFVNLANGWIYTRTTGSGTIDTGVDFNNDGEFRLGGGSLTVNTNDFDNNGFFTIVRGSIGGTGKITNNSSFSMEATNPDDVSHITCAFDNTAGTVEVLSGHLRFTGALENYAHTVLTGGDWRALAPGTIQFPDQVEHLQGGARVTGPWSGFPNVILRLISGNDSVVTGDWVTGPSVRLDGGTMQAEGGEKSGRAGISIGDTLMIDEGGRALIASGAQISAGHIQNGLASPGEAPAEIAGVGDAGGSGTLVTPLLENRGRIAPGGHGTPGTLHLQGDLAQHGEGELLIDLGGTLPGAEFDQLTVDGNVTLAGHVVVTALPEYTPVIGQQFVILTTTGAVSAAFDGVVSTNEYSYSLIHNADSVVLVLDDTPAFLSAFHLEALPGQVTARWELATPDFDSDFRLIGSKGERSWTVPHSMDDGTRFTARDHSEAVRGGGGIDYSLFGRNTDESWRLLRTDSIAVEPTASAVISLDLFPNPFNPRTTFSYTLPCAGEARLSIVDVSGREVAELFAGTLPAGGDSVVWDGRGPAGGEVASGLYLAR